MIMPKLKIYATANSRDRVLPRALADLVGTGPHRQGDYAVAAYTAAEAEHRLDQLGIRPPKGSLRVQKWRPHHQYAQMYASVLLAPGDVAAWRSNAMLHVAVYWIAADAQTPVLAGHFEQSGVLHGSTVFVPALVAEEA